MKVTLFSTASHLASATMQGFQVKALPAQPRQRLIQLPLWCFDLERDRNGNVLGYDGNAVERLMALEDVDRLADTVTLQDLDRDVNELVTIEQVMFEQVSPPDGFNGWGGRIMLTVRTV